MASVMAEARGMGLGMTLAHQHLDQLTEPVRHAVLNNAGRGWCSNCWRVTPGLLAREFGGLLTADDLQGLGAYEIVCKPSPLAAPQPPATASTRPLPPQICRR